MPGGILIISTEARGRARAHTHTHTHTIVKDSTTYSSDTITRVVYHDFTRWRAHVYD